MTGWRAQAACLGMRTDAFFPTNGDYSAVRPICARCPVRRACLAEACRHELDLYGMFGGLTPGERAAYRDRYPHD